MKINENIHKASNILNYKTLRAALRQGGRFWFQILINVNTNLCNKNEP